jgi:hypothetical protein
MSDLGPSIGTKRPRELVEVGAQIVESAGPGTTEERAGVAGNAAAGSPAHKEVIAEQPAKKRALVSDGVGVDMRAASRLPRCLPSC